MDDLWTRALTEDRIRMLLAGHELSERQMFGATAFLVHGHLVCAPGDGMLLVRVGRDGMERALADPDAAPMQNGQRTMSGFVQVSLDSLDEQRLRAWIDVALDVIAELPPK